MESPALPVEKFSGEIFVFMDVVITMAIAYKMHHGKPATMKTVAENIMGRVKYDYTRQLCQTIIDDPKNTLSIINILTMKHFKMAIIKPSKRDLQRG